MAMTGTVKFFNGERGYGFIEAEDGHEVYFHQNSVTPDGRYVIAEGNAGIVAIEIATRKNTLIVPGKPRALFVGRKTGLVYYSQSDGAGDSEQRSATTIFTVPAAGGKPKRVAKIERLRRRVGPRDGVKLEQYLDAIRDVERAVERVEGKVDDLIGLSPSNHGTESQAATDLIEAHFPRTSGQSVNVVWTSPAVPKVVSSASRRRPSWPRPRACRPRRQSARAARRGRSRSRSGRR